MPDHASVGLVRHVVVFDAADVETESAFWAGLLGGFVVDDDPQFHCVIDGDGRWLVGVQSAPDHTPPDWPDGSPQQVHLDLHVSDAAAAHERAIELGAQVLQAGDLDEADGYVVYADPAGHPFCLGWGQPDDSALQAFLTKWTARGGDHVD